ncbi:hypothetical protein HanOQP8_Chr03g0109921 [Helianthus annuus]|nr:hypothetical protein HanOQP8_Chr03g0109921 [Helianthus annuus]
MGSRHEFSDTDSNNTDNYSSGSDEPLDEVSTGCNKNTRGNLGILQAWEPVYVLVCTTGLFIDPLFFYALSISDSYLCVFIDGWFAVTVTVVRCMTDVLYVANLWLQFKLNKWSRHDVRLRRDDKSSCNVANRLVTVAWRRVLFDFFVILPIPQVYYIIRY